MYMYIYICLGVVCLTNGVYVQPPALTNENEVI